MPVHMIIYICVGIMCVFSSYRASVGTCSSNVSVWIICVCILCMYICMCVLGIDNVCICRYVCRYVCMHVHMIIFMYRYGCMYFVLYVHMIVYMYRYGCVYFVYICIWMYLHT